MVYFNVILYFSEKTYGDYEFRRDNFITILETTALAL